MKIGIDIDGVLTDIEQWQLDYGSKFFSKYKKCIIKNDGYEITEIFNVSDESDDEFWDEYLYEYVTKEPARKFASEVIKKLKDENNEILVTHGGTSRVISSYFYGINDDGTLPPEDLKNCEFRKYL